MTKRETARQIAKHMNQINKSVDIERQTALLLRGMTKHELDKALESFTKAAAAALNSEAGQELTDKLLRQVITKNPNTTPEEWKEIQARFLAYMTIRMAQEINRA